MGVRFRCKRSGNFVSFSLDSDIVDMRKHEGYEEVKDDTEKDSDCSKDETCEGGGGNSGKSKGEESANAKNANDGQGQVLKKRGRPSSKK